MKKITKKITTPFINAMALLKLAGLEATGGQAALAIEQGLVKLDGTVISEKRKKVYPGSTLTLQDKIEIAVVQAENED